MTTRTKEQNGVATEALAGDQGFSLISNEKLLQLYTSMVKCRMIGERVQALMKRRNLAFKDDFAIGREAALVGAAIDLLPEDTLAPSQTNLLFNFIKCLRPDPTISLLLAGGGGWGTSGHQFTAATDAAQSNKMDKNSKIVAVFRDCEAASTESWNQALSLADTKQLPMLFVRYSDGLEKLDVQTWAKEKAAWPYGFPSITVDGSDVVAVYRVATEAITHARKGNGPTLIDCKRDRFDDHAEIDPILKMDAYLSRKGLFSKKSECDAVAAFSQKLNLAIEAAENAPSSDDLESAI